MTTPPSIPTSPPVTGYRAALAPAKLTVTLTGVVIQLPNAVQAAIGRADPVSGFFPEVDLTPHGALDNGVGRKHARLFVQSGQILLEDLDSTNGTKINGQKLAPRQPQTLRDGDQVALGSMVLRFSDY
jgi:pSer/pThr/pTyr-binding forkhead associated (FHA) protein